MNEQYLWNKTGSDPEIERLEGLLDEFRYRPIGAPNPLAKKSPAWSWLRPLAFAAIPACMLAVFGLLLLPGNPTMREAAEPIASVPVTETRSVATSVDPPPAAAPQQEIVTPTPKRALLIKRGGKHSSRPRALLAAAPSSNPQDVRLTREEQFAYDQLRLALSISGTHLKAVKDSVNGTED